MKTRVSSPHSIEVFKALSDRTRQMILAFLNEEERNVNELCHLLRHMTQPTVSHHLQILTRCALVSRRKKGKMVYYSMNKQLLRDRVRKYIARFDVQGY